MNKDIKIIREMVKQYLELSNETMTKEKIELWKQHNSLEGNVPLIYVRFGIWDQWVREELFQKKGLQCETPLFKGIECHLSVELMQKGIGDDRMLPPTLPLGAVRKYAGDGPWGIPFRVEKSDVQGGASRNLPALESLDNMKKLITPKHIVDEEETMKKYNILQDAVGDLITIDIDRSSMYRWFDGDIATHLARLVGLEEMMIKMLTEPKEMHELLAFMRDGILNAHEETEKAGHWTLSSMNNQAEVFCRELEDTKPNTPCSRKDIWGYMAAQECTLISPEMHDEFIFQYQKPIMDKFGIIAYGCCEDLTKKIDMLRQQKNLRTIAVTPVADVAKCAEQIGSDYAISWRPNPADMVCCGFNEKLIRKIIGEGLAAFKANNCNVHINLKDISTVQGDPNRLKLWTKIVREEILMIND